MRYLTLFLAGPLLAQFSGLGTTPDGSELYFTSTLRQRGTTQPLHGKLFRLNDREMKPVLVIPVEPVNASWSNYHSIRAPYLNERGELAGYHADRTCYVGSFAACQDFEGSIYNSETYQGALHFSPNRRYALNVVWRGLGTYRHQLLDLSLRPARVLAEASDYFASEMAVTNSGQVFRVFSGQLWRLASGGQSFVALTERSSVRWLQGLAVNPDEARAYSFAVDQTESQLVEIPFATPVPRPIGEPLAASCDRIRIASDGSVLAACPEGEFPRKKLFRAPPGADGPWQPFARADEAVTDWVLSADGEVVWYLSQSFAFHKVFLRSGHDEARLPGIGVTIRGEPASPGSLLYVEGDGLASYELHLRYETGPDLTLPALRRSEHTLVFQVPWDLPGLYGGYTFELSSEQPSLFELRFRYPTYVAGLQPRFFNAIPSQLPRPTRFAAEPVVAHQDFSRLVSPQDPGQPGEIVHLWAVNLGEVNGPIRTGETAPINSPRPLVTPLACRIGASRTPLEVVFAGLAPGTVGLYQVSIRLPRVLPPGPSLTLECGNQTNQIGEALLPIPH